MEILYGTHSKSDTVVIKILAQAEQPSCLYIYKFVSIWLSRCVLLQKTFDLVWLTLEKSLVKWAHGL